jgi:hypothetical protein
VSREEGLKMVDRQARRYLKMSGKEFIRRWKAGEFGDPDNPYRPELTHVVSLLPIAGIWPEHSSG